MHCQNSNGCSHKSNNNVDKNAAIQNKQDDDSQYAFTEEASLAMAGLNTTSTGFKIPDEVAKK